MNKWTVENRTTNMSYSAGTVQIHVEGYYSIYLKVIIEHFFDLKW